MYISIYYQALVIFGTAFGVICFAWLFLLLIAAKIEDKRRAEKFQQRNGHTKIIKLDEYEEVDQRYDWKEKSSTN